MSGAEAGKQTAQDAELSPAQLAAVLAEARAVLDAAGLPHAVASELHAGERAGSRPRRELAARIDHTQLSAQATPADIRRLCAQAVDAQFASVCVNSGHVALAASCVRPPVAVCSVVGFPLGAAATEVKVCEARFAIGAGAAELDLVAALGLLVAAVPPQPGESPDLDGLRAVSREVRAVVEAARAADGPAPPERRLVKLIVETGLLSPRAAVFGALLGFGAGAAFVKTSTGMLGRGATPGDVALLRAAAGERGGVKASGGISGRAQALALLEAGADRLGSSASLRLIGPGEPAGPSG